MTNDVGIAAHLTALRCALADVCAKVGRNPADITLVAVTKTRTAEEANTAIRAGVDVIGENRVQEAAAKFPHVLPVRRHLIGHLQTNKAADAVRLFDVIESVDSVRLAELLSKECAKQHKTLDIFVQANIAAEDTKSGFSVADLANAVAAIRELPHLHLVGLMTIGPHVADEARIRDVFTMGTRLADALQLPHYSAGMSGDWPIAVACGATHIRVGTAIFGEREYAH